MAVTWQDPITTWGDGDRYTYNDWNRIVYDTAWLLEAIEYEHYDEQTFLQSWKKTITDFLTQHDWTYMRMILLMINSRLGNTVIAPGNTVTAQDFNLMETLLLRAKNKIDQRIAIQYTNDGLYAGDPETWVR